MSSEKYRSEALRWLRQGLADLDAAQGSLDLQTYEWASFQAQQAGEKLLKACWFFFCHDPWGHSLVRLIHDFPDETLRAALEPLLDAAKSLDKMYIPTRYPNGLPDMIPAEVYTRQEALQALEHARAIACTAKELCRYSD